MLSRKIIYCIAVSAPRGSWLRMLVPPSSLLFGIAVFLPPPPLPHLQAVAFRFLLVPGDPESPAKGKHPICVTAKIYTWRLRHEPGERRDLCRRIRGSRFVIGSGHRGARGWDLSAGTAAAGWMEARGKGSCHRCLANKWKMISKKKI